MGIKKNIIKKDSYKDSVFLMQIASETGRMKGIEKISLMMGTGANKEILRESKILTEDGSNACENDLIIALEATDEKLLASAVAQIEERFSAGERTGSPDSFETSAPTLEAASERLGNANFALISIPGAYAASQAQRALKTGLNVMIFSDNVPLEQEIALKKEAAARNLLLMGPDCGTAIINSVPLGFANVIPPGDIGITGASGTGIQEISVTIAKKGGGITQAFGTGGRDLSEKVGGITMLETLKYLSDDPETRVILIVSKPPHPKVAQKITEAASGSGKPTIICFLGMETAREHKGIVFTSTLEEAALEAVRLSTGKAPDADTKAGTILDEMAGRTAERLESGRRYARGLYSGGTLCDEAIDIFSRHGIEMNSNLSNPKTRSLENSAISVGNTFIDMGEDEFTVGRPHPMIDLTLRNERILEEAGKPETAVILFDLVLGYGSHPDPAPEMATVLKKASEKTVLIASICGTDSDPQDYQKQKKILEDCGVTVTDTNAKAAALASRIIVSLNR